MELNNVFETKSLVKYILLGSQEMHAISLSTAQSFDEP